MLRFDLHGTRAMQSAKIYLFGQPKPSLQVETVRASDDGDIDSILARKLRDAFAPILRESIPDRFAELMDKIAGQEEPK